MVPYSVLPEGRDEISPFFCKISPKFFIKQKKQLQKPSKLAFKGF